MDKKILKLALPKKNSILWRSVRHSVLIAMITVLSLSAISYLFANSLLEKQVMSQLTSLVSSSEQQLQSRLLNVRRTGASMARIVLPLIDSEDVPLAIQGLYQEEREADSAFVSLCVYNSTGSIMASRGGIIPLPTPLPKATAIIPALGKNGFEYYDIFTPIKERNGSIKGWVALRYSASSLVKALLSSTELLGETGKMEISIIDKGNLLILQYSTESDRSYITTIGTVDSLLKQGKPVAFAVRGKEGLGYAKDYNGNDVLTAYRYLPDVGWGLVANIHTQEVATGPRALMGVMIKVGSLFLIIAAILAFSLSRTLTAPLLEMAYKITKVGPGNWKYGHTVHTGDELETLDSVVANITEKLGKIYVHLEDEVEDRTDKLKSNFAKDNAIFEAISFGLLVLDKEGKILEVNPAAKKILRHSESDMIGKSATNLLDIRLKQKQLVREENPIEKCFITKQEVRVSPEIHLSVTCADSTYMPARISVTPLFEEKECNGAIVVFQDITTERQLDYMKTEFITLVSHQLRTPLSTVQWYLELLATEDQEKLSEEQKSFVVELRLAVHRMTNIITQLMDASRLQQGGVEPMWQDIDLTKFIHDITNDMRSLSNEKGVICKSDLPTESVMISSDPMLLNIILQNLLSNAVKYSKQGGEVEVIVRRKANDVQIDIKDMGIGIPLGDQDRIFQKLFRAHNARRAEVNGSGLGLYSSKKVIEKLGGEIRFKSEENKGTTFTIIFPLQ